VLSLLNFKIIFRRCYFFEIWLGCLFRLLIYKPVFPHILVALKFLHYHFTASFFDFHLLELSSKLDEEEIELFK